MTAPRLPKAIREALAKLEPKVRDAFLKAIEDIRRIADPKLIAAMIEQGDIAGAVRAIRFEPTLFGPVDRALAEAYFEGGLGALASLPVIRDPNDGGRIVLGFDGRHPRAEQWARDMSSRLITEVVADQQQMAADVIREAIIAGRGPASTALDIVGRINKTTGKREGGFIGLTSGQAKWAQAAEAQLAAGDYDGYRSRSLRNKQFDKLIARAERDGRTLTKAEIDRIIGAYKNNILRYRGENIARTESITALRAGRREGYEQLIDSGAIEDRQIKRTWSATGDVRTRASHMHMNGQVIRGLKTAWNVAGSLMMYPGDVSLGAAAEEVINCRCFEQYRIEYD